jgi:hypothetical protein
VFVFLYPVSRKKQGATQKNIFIEEEEEEVEEPLGREFVRSHSPLKSAPLQQKKRLVYMLCEKERSAIGADTIKSAGFIYNNTAAAAAVGYFFKVK